MRFAVERAGDGFEIIALFDEEDKREANRMEGARVAIKATSHRAFFGGIKADDVHPDHLALAAVLTFFPFIGPSATFAWFVSPALVRALALLGKTTKSVVMGEPYENTGTRPGLLYGGGADSCAAHILYPDALLIHGYDMKPGSKECYPSRLRDVLERLRERGTDSVSLETNCRNLCSPGGWVGWFTVLAYGLLYAKREGLGYVMTGSVLSASFLGTGTGYRDIFSLPESHGPTRNVWQEACAVVGVPTFAPLASLCEPTTSALAFSKYGKDSVVSCTSNNGFECNECYKCLRKKLLYDVMTWQFTGNGYDSFKHHADKLPRKEGDAFSPCYANLATIMETRGWLGQLPDWIRDAIGGLPRVRWDGCYYPDGLDIVPPKFRFRLERALQERFAVMAPEKVAQVCNWNKKPVV